MSVFPALRFQCSRPGLAGFPKYVYCLLLSAIIVFFIAPAAFAEDFGFQHGTAVVVLRSPKALYAAVDSKEIDQEYRDGKLSVDEKLACKIRKVGPYYSIVAGIMRGTNGFDALQAAVSAYKPGDSLEALGQSLRQSVPVTLAPMLAELLAQDPGMFSQNYARQAALHLTLIGNEQNAPKVVVVEFQAVQSGTGDITLATRTMSCPGDCTAPNAGYFLGAHEAVEASVHENPAILTRPTEQNIEQLIDLEYASRPDIVGGPITMVKVTPSGSAVLRNGACALD
jgi:hypothetical protein